MAMFDIRTIIYLEAIGNIACALALHLHRNQPYSDRAFRFFMVGKALQAFAWALLGLRGEIVDPVSVYLGNVLLIAGFTLEALALTTAAEPDRGWERVFGALGLGGVLAFLGVAHLPGLRIPVASVATLLVFGTAAVAILRRPAPSRVQVAVGVLALAFCAVLVARALLAFPAFGHFELLASNSVQACTFVMVFIVLFVNGVAFLLMQKEAGDRRLEESVVKLQKALSEIKILGGLLPICASCKKIRDDQGYWNQIETYIASHSDAVFTHGICPDCREQLYPGLGRAKGGQLVGR